MNILSQPTPISLTGNPIKLKVQETDIWQQSGRKCKFDLIFTIGQTILDGDYINLKWGNYDLTITFRDNANSNLAEYPSGQITMGWRSGLIIYLNSIYNIQSYFKAYPSGGNDYFSLISWFEGSDYTIQGDTNIPQAKLLMGLDYDGLDAIMYPGLQFLCLAKHSAGAFIGQEAITPDHNGIVHFDMSIYLYSFLANMRQNFIGFHYPSQTTKVFKHGVHVLPFVLHYGVKYHSKFVTLHSTATLRAILGGKQHTAHTDFYNDLTKSKMFLTNQVWARISRNSPVRLFYYSIAAETFSVKAKIFRNDGTDETVTISTHNATVHTIYEIDTTLSHIIAPGSNIWRYDVWVEAGGDIRSLAFEYHIDSRHYDNEQHFIFRNSYGGYDTVRTTGRFTRSPEIMRDEFTDDNYKVRALLNLETTNYTANTGSVSAGEKRWLDDLLLSKEVYWISGNRPTPIVITSSKTTPETDNQRRFNLQFDFKLSHSEEYHSTDFSSGATSQPGIDV